MAGEKMELIQTAQSQCKELSLIEELVMKEITEETFRYPSIKIFERIDEIIDFFGAEQAEKFKNSETTVSYVLGKNQIFIFVPFFRRLQRHTGEIQGAYEKINDMFEELQLFHYAFHSIRHAWQEQFLGIDYIRSCMEQMEEKPNTNPLDLDANTTSYRMVEKYKDIIASFNISSEFIESHLKSLKPNTLI